MTQWYYSKMGLQQGPVPEDELRTKIRRGEIGDSNLVWRDGMDDWLPLAQVAELQAPQETPQAVATVPDPVPKGSAVVPTSISLEKPDLSFPVRQSGGSVPLPQPPAYQGNYVGPAIPTYMWQSVVATVIGLPFCCLLAMPFGIVAIVFASKVEGLRVQGDILGATTASNNAKNWMIASYACSALGIVLQLLSLATRSV